MLNGNGQSRVKDIELLMKLCDDYLDYIDGFGNECAYTDMVIAQIKEVAENITEDI